ncbi:hypothetical protein ZEAMMB73_Zm00001d008926 [Zea mays]|jgi:hypothetical protein|uniref:Uncharacterized protein n=1 Tax=Zea mays TaxID=4577 RepID=K7UV84_MAIZE|nr:hypothetical protein ZEAMMB73_Zm00001d008926 [Zea mays]
MGGEHGVENGWSRTKGAQGDGVCASSPWGRRWLKTKLREFGRRAGRARPGRARQGKEMGKKAGASALGTGSRGAARLRASSASTKGEVEAAPSMAEGELTMKVEQSQGAGRSRGEGTMGGMGKTTWQPALEEDGEGMGKMTLGALAQVLEWRSVMGSRRRREGGEPQGGARLVLHEINREEGG